MADKTIDPEKRYRVTLTRAIELAPKVWARPADDVVVKGKILSGILSAVASFEEV